MRKILVTGGASGFGEAIVRQLSINNLDEVHFSYCGSEEKAKKLESEYGNVKAYHCDFTKKESVDEFAAKISSIDPDVLINNALTGFHKKHFHKLSPEDFERSFRENVLPVIKITSESIKIFRKKLHGKIINILSASIVNLPPIGWSEYAANKNYILSLSKSWAAENRKYNITSNSVSPSFMLTGLNKDVDERSVEEMMKSLPDGKLLSIEDAAKTVSFLIDASGHINGVNIILNSGLDVI